MKRRRRIFTSEQACTVILVALSAAGCDRPLFGPARQPEPTPSAARAEVPLLDLLNPDRRERKTDTLLVVRVQFDVLRIDLPLDAPPGSAGGVAHSRKIWNHIDELRLGAEMAALLARNGMRIGVATRDDWPAMRSLFEGNDAKVIHAPQTVNHGMPLTLEVGAFTEPEAIFSYRADGDLVGDTFDAGTRFIHLAYATDAAAPARTILRVTPEVNAAAAGSDGHRRAVEGAFQRAPSYMGRVYNQLSVELALGPGEFLVIGPADATRMNCVLGNRFLTCAHEGRVHETVLCIAPQPFWTDLSGTVRPVPDLAPR